MAELLSIDATDKRYGGRVIVRLDGRDISDDCMSAMVPQAPGESAPGSAILVSRGADGDILTDGDYVRTHKETGMMCWEWRT